MPISSNARTDADKEAAKGLIRNLSKKVGRALVSVEFDEEAVAVSAYGQTVALERPDFDAWADAGFPWAEDVGPDMSEIGTQVPVPAAADETVEEDEPPRPPRRRRVQPEPDPVDVADQAAEADDPEPEPEDEDGDEDEGLPAPQIPARPDPEEDEAEAPPAPRRRPAPAQDEVLDALVAEAFEIEQDERSGKHGSNVARFRRGELMLRLRDISIATKEPMKGLLERLNNRSLALASQHNVPDFSVISEQEATATRRVVNAFGSSGEFSHVTGLDPATGAPLVDDSGNPIQLPLTEVPINKLYPLVEYADSVDQDLLVSFAHSQTEKVVKAAKRVSKRTEEPFRDVIQFVSGLRTPAISPLGIGQVEVYPPEKDVLDVLKERAGEAPESEVASLKTSRGWYESTWVPLKALVDSVAREFIQDAVNETSNATSNVFVLERILTQLFNPFEENGVQRVLGALVQAEEMTMAQANDFLNHFQMDPETFEWARTEAGVSEEEAAEVEEGEEDEGEDDLLDGEFEIDTPEPEEAEGADEEPEEEEDLESF